MSATPTVETIWSQYRQQLQAFLRSRVSDEHQVEDLLQDILLKSYQKLPELSSGAKLKPWLYQIANHSIVDYYRRKGRDVLDDSETLWYQDNQQSLMDSLSECISPFVQSLPDGGAELLTQIDLQGTPQKRYAEEHQLPYSTLKSRVHKSRQQLRALFDACCDFELDAGGRLSDCTTNSKGCKNC
ncbi:RNA polymerase sigma factor SigZ [Paraferrimonas sedimenticola]|uniref:RNA polymerase sigma factor SigZ n=1 Tax=Paraferrimonas sedimenticola TaxID=375674 RepID=A0AA37RYJ6_9GAMM|nr:RNA polymerase sigma factor SigZ [Paraferrimonas sedimenticola]GLP97639.1 RNA polymerase sigma factor SigZ [Paraferrimonas sedimenticola]